MLDAVIMLSPLGIVLFQREAAMVELRNLHHSYRTVPRSRSAMYDAYLIIKR